MLSEERDVALHRPLIVRYVVGGASCSSTSSAHSAICCRRCELLAYRTMSGRSWSYILAPPRNEFAAMSVDASTRGATSRSSEERVSHYERTVVELYLARPCNISHYERTCRAISPSSDNISHSERTLYHRATSRSSDNISHYELSCRATYRSSDKLLHCGRSDARGAICCRRS